MKKHVAAASVALLLAAPTAASAVSVLYSWQGNDRSYNSSSGKTVYACDGEDDGNQAEAQMYRSGQGRTVVRDSAGDGCTSSYNSRIVTQHRIVELRWKDPVGEWVYPK